MGKKAIYTIILLLSSLNIWGQMGEIRGKVIDPELGEGLPFATVIENLPTRNVNSIAANKAGVCHVDEGASLGIKGSRAESTEYYIDGIRARDNDLIPHLFCEQIEPTIDSEINDFENWDLGNEIDEAELNNHLKNKKEINTNNVLIYPNPSQGLINLEWTEKTEQAYILDANAKILFRFNYLDQDHIQIDLSNFPVGLYFLKLLKEGEVITKKILINR